MRYRVVETLAVNESGVGGRGVDWLDNGYQTHNQYPSHAQPNLMIGNHDLVRFGDLLQRGGLADVNDAEYWQRHKAAFAFKRLTPDQSLSIMEMKSVTKLMVLTQRRQQYVCGSWRV